MAEKFLCIMAGYDEATDARLAEIQKAIDERGFIGTHTRNIPFHITLGTASPAQEKETTEALRRVARETAPFGITFNHIGLFTGARVLFVAPDPNRELLAVKERFGSSFDWTPHTTMLIDEPEHVLSAVPIAMEKFGRFHGRVEYLHLYEFFPARRIAAFRLGE